MRDPWGDAEKPKKSRKKKGGDAPAGDSGKPSVPALPGALRNPFGP